MNMKLSDLLLFVLKSVILGLALGFVYILISESLQNKDTDDAGAAPPPRATSYADAVNKIAPTVVSIYTQSTFQINNNLPPEFRDITGFNGLGRTVTRNYLGSGVIVSPDGYIVTNKHVINNAQQVVISLWNNQVFQASFIGADTLTDLAVLKIEADNLIPADFADSDLLRTGDVVLAIGNPFGLSQSVSLGIVSATGRKGLDVSVFENFIQTDAAINEGNSGGALINPLGQVVGISTASYNQYGAVGINFAIPSNTTKQIIDSVIEYGKVVRGWLGINLFRDIAYRINNIERPERGVMVASTFNNSPAQLSEIKPFDVITHVNGQAVNSPIEYYQIIGATSPGDAITLRLISAGQTLEKTLNTMAIDE